MPFRILNPVLSLVLLAGLLVAVTRPPVPSGPLRRVSFSGAIGEKNVDAFGAYRREIPLRVPSFHGIEPSLRLVYSSRGGNGLAGTGWTLTGLPEITRTSPSLGAPAFNTSARSSAATSTCSPSRSTAA